MLSEEKSEVERKEMRDNHESIKDRIGPEIEREKRVQGRLFLILTLIFLLLLVVLTLLSYSWKSLH